MNRTLRGYALVLLGAALWATLGLFYTHLIDDFGLSPRTVVFFRALLTAAVLFAAHVAAWGARGRAGGVFPSVTRWRDLAGFAVFGAVGIAVFYNVYVNAVDLTGMAVAAVLMYTAPAWVTVISALFMGEQLTRIKAAAVVLAMAGAGLVARIYDPNVLRLNPRGVLFGLGAGLTYGLYTIFSKVNLRQHPPWTVIAFALGFGSLFMLPFQDFAEVAGAVTSPETLPWLLGVTLGPTLLGGISFNMGLRDVPASNASIIATLEPVIATVLGWQFLGETLEWLQLGGGVLVLGAVMMLSRTRRGGTGGRVPLAQVEEDGHHACAECG
jgi:DME family drug/metabolite transporter